MYIHSWSGGKDSTAGVILDHIHGLPPSKIIFSEVMFDKKRGISGELPEHIDFVRNKATPIFEGWGYEVEIVHAKKDYLDIFFHVIQKSKVQDRIGKYAGWVLGGMCAASRDLKIKPICDYYKRLDLAETEYKQYVGIAIDEPERLKRLEGSNKVSLLQRFGFTEQMAFELCKKFDLLSPIYEISKRGGCWFCPNQGYAELAHTKIKYPELWAELRELDKEKNVISHGFKYGKTLKEIEVLVEKEIKKQYYATQQQTLYKSKREELFNMSKKQGDCQWQ